MGPKIVYHVDISFAKKVSVSGTPNIHSCVHTQTFPICGIQKYSQHIFSNVRKDKFRLFTIFMLACSRVTINRITFEWINDNLQVVEGRL